MELADEREFVSSPFDPHGISFTPVSPKLATARLIVGLPWLALPAVGFAVPALLVSPWFWAGSAVFVALLVWVWWLIPRQVRAMGYAEAADDLLIRKGVMFRSMSIVPYGRMQFVDVQQGPVDRAFGISKVTLNTASPTTDAVLPGLPDDDAARLRDRLTARGEARLAGL